MTFKLLLASVWARVINAHIYIFLCSHLLSPFYHYFAVESKKSLISYMHRLKVASLSCYGRKSLLLPLIILLLAT